jgi:hypothetical protein
MRRAMLPLLCALTLAACGGEESADPIERVPESGGVREQVDAARQVSPQDFPAVEGRTFDDLVAEVAGRDGGATLATSVFTPGTNRLAFGTISDDGQFVYGKSAVYVAGPRGKDVAGPFVAPADLLVTAPAYRSRQAAGEEDPFAAIYAAQIEVDKPGEYQVLTVTRTADGPVAGTTQIAVRSEEADRVPDVGERAPEAATDTIESVRGDVELLDTRQPPSDMHERSLDEVLGEKPVVLLFATPQLCQSRVCGPVTDVALELKQSYGDRVEFIHQEVFARNDPARGLRDALVEYSLETEPWLFAIDRNGRITARLEGSFGFDAMEQAIKTAL